VKLFSSKLEILFLTLSLAPSIVVSSYIIYNTPAINELFVSLDEDVLTLPTRLFSNYFYFLVLVVPITIFLIWKNWPFEKYRSVYCILLGYVSAGLLLKFWSWAMYLPILKMGAP
jgi:hypothetical protein